ncbi:MAG TPA: trehalose-6-phosphate synthase [Acidimicrobiales bacterium]|jgi:trehalose 6-phosphate synthase|nr:trehalose-6-phosphate synthase [Acidimicrobiales bacterium]
MPPSGTTPLAVVSNRGPLSFVRDADGELRATRGSGGMIAVIGPGAAQHDALWLATAITEADREATAAGEVSAAGFRVRSVHIDPVQFRQYYDVIANQTLWFLHHGLWDLPRRPRLDRHWWAAWEGFVAVNHLFAAAVAAEMAPGGTVLIQDYQLSLVGAELARLRPDVASAAFLHIPFCPPSDLQILPDAVVDTLLRGLAGAGAVGFHSPRWAAAFEACCRERGVTLPEVFVSPAAADGQGLAATAASEETDRELDRLEAYLGDRHFIVRTDRIELSKNLLRGFYAFDELLEREVRFRGRVVFGAFVYPSRNDLAEYLGYRHEVEAVVRAINAKWSDGDWTPILLETSDNYPRAVAALRRYDVLMVNPIRDGLNLVAKEGPLVNQRDGVLVLSPGAGAWDELGEHAVEAHPFDIVATARALATALELPGDERAARATALRKVVTARTPEDWFADSLTAARVPDRA